MLEFLKHPWPWYIAGPIIGLIVPALLLAGNKSFGISSALRHVCTACFPSKIPFFNYDWKKELWNMFFVIGILIGGALAVTVFENPDPMEIDPALASQLSQYGITNYNGFVPPDVMNWNTFLTLKGFLLMVVGGFLVGFGTLYAGGCTSGHSISGLSNLQWPSLVATCSFMAGGLLMSNVILHFILLL